MKENQINQTEREKKNCFISKGREKRNSSLFIVVRREFPIVYNSFNANPSDQATSNC